MMPPHEIKRRALSITTRGIGFGTCNLCYIAAATAGVEPPVYAMYRLFLGLAEVKLGMFTYCQYDPDPQNVYTCKVKRYMFDRPQAVTIVPAPIKRIIDAIGVIKHNGTEYSPVVAGLVRDAAGRLIPRPENLLLSNLRETVVALSNPDTPAQYRAAFKQNCPIPGAVWDNDLLLNVDEIIPEEYDIDEDLWDDMWPVSMFLILMQEKYPLIAGGPLVAPGESVSKAALISNNMWDVRAKPRLVGECLQEYCKRCHPHGYLGPYYELEEISDVDSLNGQVALLGEMPNTYVLGELAAPVLDVHKVRGGKLDPTGTPVTADYITSLMVTNEALLSPAAPLLPAQRHEAVVAPRRPENGNSRGRGSWNRRRNWQ